MAVKNIERVRAKRICGTEAERFWLKVDDQVFGPGGCWIWTAGRSHGYGKFTEQTEAHRWAYENLLGPIPAGMTLDHRVCRNKLCVNPAHLFVCTRRENAEQPDGAIGLSRVRRDSRSHCKRGHEFTPSNTYRSVKGYRTCKVCLRSAQANHRLRTRLSTAYVSS